MLKEMILQYIDGISPKALPDWPGKSIFSKPKAPSSIADLPTPQILALCLWGEARGEGMLGQLMVGCVIRNRSIMWPVRRWYGESSLTRSIILHPFQFSCFNKKDPNLQKMFQRDEPTDFAGPSVAAAIILHEGNDKLPPFPDITDGSTHYHHHSIRPSWANSPKMVKTVSFNSHIFYREEV